MSEATILFHQGFTDILNHLPILSYYVKLFSKITVIIRKDAIAILEHYVLGSISSSVSNIELIGLEKHGLDSLFGTPDTTKLFLEIHNLEKTYLLFFGFFDRFRSDSYQNAFGHTMHKGTFFCEAFYKAYNLPYSLRIDAFEYDRSSLQIQTIEKSRFNQFCLKHSIDQTKPYDYVLYHEDVENKVTITFANELTSSIKSLAININKISDSFFDCLKILENAKELHLMDSAWACLLYLFDAKYNIMNNKKVYLYAKRDYIEMFRSPKLCSNWILISK